MTTIVQSSWLNDVNGSWANAKEWTGDVVPNDTTANEYDVTLGGSATTGTSAFKVTSSADETIGFLTINSNATLDITADVFTVDSEVNPFSNVYNLGVLEIGSAARMVFGAAGSPSNDSSEIWNTGTVDLDGTLAVAAPWLGLYGPTGVFTMVGGSIVGADTGATATFENKNETVQGSGVIGTGGSLYLSNDASATIDANSTAALTINTGTNWIENAGTIETTGAGGLTIKSNMQQDGQLTAGKGTLTVTGDSLVTGGGDVNVSATGSLVLNQGQFGIGGVITIAKGGVITTTAGNTTAVTSSNAFAGDVLQDADIEDSGTIDVVDDSTLNLNGTLYGAGAIDLSGSTDPTKLEIFGNGVALDETGDIVLGASGENSIVSNGSGVQFTDNFAKILGAGTIGDTWLRIVENPGGLINADDSVGLTIVGDSAAVGAGSEGENYFAGTVETTGAGGLTIEGGTLGNAGYLKANGAGALTLENVQIDNGGGVVETLGSGSIVLADNTQIFSEAYVEIAAAGSLSTSAGDTSDGIRTTVINKGKINIVAGSTLIVDGHWTNTGSVNLEGTTAAVVEIRANSALDLIGKGKVNLQGASSSIISAGSGTQIDNVGNTIAGSGVIGDTYMDVNNESNGVIDATGSTGLILDSTPYDDNTNTTYLYNAGTMESSSKGGLTIEQAMYSPGKLVANTGGNIIAEGAVYGVGTTTINGTGSVQFDAEADNDVYFASGATGSLILEDPAQLYGNIWGFGAGDAIDLSNFAYSKTGTAINSTLSGFGALDAALVLTNGTANSSPLYLEGNYTAANLTSLGLVWQFSSDGHEIGTTGTDGTLIKLVSAGGTT